MKTSYRIVALVLAMFAITLMPLKAPGAVASYIYVHNVTTTAWVWITVYSEVSDHNGHHGAEGAWCVPPGKYDQHGLSVEIREVRAEISENPNCRVVLYDTTKAFPGDKNRHEYRLQPAPYKGYEFKRTL